MYLVYLAERRPIDCAIHALVVSGAVLMCVDWLVGDIQAHAHLSAVFVGTAVGCEWRSSCSVPPPRKRLPNPHGVASMVFAVPRPVLYPTLRAADYFDMPLFSIICPYLVSWLLFS